MGQVMPFGGLLISHLKGCSRFGLLAYRSCASAVPQLDPFSKAYASAVALKRIQPDESQIAACRVLSRVSRDVGDYLDANSLQNDKAWLSRLFSGHPLLTAPKGAYIWSNRPGCGKTMLVDMMYASSGSPSSKRRDHFHSFVLEVHARLHERRVSSIPGADVIGHVADELASEFKLLDEFQVTDIGDAMIIHPLFKRLFASGVVVVATSNRSPDELYANGIQRDLFLPFIPIMRRHMEVHEMGPSVDYRLRHAGAQSSTYFLDEDGGSTCVRRLFAELAGGFPVGESRLSVLGRTLLLSTAVPSKRIALFTFEELCERPLSSGDYTVIVSQYHTVCLTDVPLLHVIMDRNAVRRFTTFVDHAYEARVKLMMHAKALPANLIVGADDSRRAYTEEGFAVRRLVSRLIEMQTSDEYLAAPWRPPQPI